MHISILFPMCYVNFYGSQAYIPIKKFIFCKIDLNMVGTNCELSKNEGNNSIVALFYKD